MTGARLIALLLVAVLLAVVLKSAKSGTNIVSKAFSALETWTLDITGRS